MRLAVIAVTKQGARLAETLAGCLESVPDVYIKAGSESGIAAKRFDSLQKLVDEIFTRYDGLVFIMATGIVVRVIAAHLRDKQIDPAVVVMDDSACHVISLLSGHIGGANDLAVAVATAVGAVPVITTATDVAGKPAVDILAKKLGLGIEPFSMLKQANAAIVNGLRVKYFIDGSKEFKLIYHEKARQMGIVFEDLERINAVSSDFAVIITERKIAVSTPHIFLCPPALFVGVGCRRGTMQHEIINAISEACTAIDKSLASIAALGSAEVKRNEAGLLQAAQRLAVPITFFSNEQLQDCIEQYQLSTSEYVKDKIGVGNVCEAAALLLGQQPVKILMPKTKYPKITVAIAEVKLP